MVLIVVIELLKDMDKPRNSVAEAQTSQKSDNYTISSSAELSFGNHPYKHLY